MDKLNLYHELEQLLRMNSRYCMDDGRLLKNQIVEDALSIQPLLVKELLGNEKMKKVFFTDVEGVMVFDKIKFQRFVSDTQFLGGSYTMFKNKIGLANENGRFVSESREVVLSWPYKDCMLEGGQTKEDAKRNEVFWNETLAPDEVNRLTEPKVFSNFKRYDKEGEHQVDHLSDNDNLIIKGNNLLALHSLKKKYAGQVKLIYIDPPYYFRKKLSTDTFKYNSNFHLSTWLTFMRDRLECAKHLLAPSGTIWIHMGDEGMHYLKLVADQVFGINHFIGTLPRRTRNGKSDVPFNFSQDFDWLLVYTNVEESQAVMGRAVERKYYTTEDYPGKPWRLADLTKQTTAKERENSFFTMVDPKTGKEYPPSEKRTWCITKETFDSHYKRGYIVFPDDYDFLKITKPYSRKFKYEDEANGKLSSIISDCQIQQFLKSLLYDCKNEIGNNEINDLFGRDEFDYAKPENLIKIIMEAVTNEGDLVMDFFSGSGTTVAVAHKLGRKYIGCEQIDHQIELTVNRLNEVICGEQGGVSKSIGWQGGGSFVYCELSKANGKFADEIENAETTGQLMDIWNRMKATDYLNYKVDVKEVDANVADFEGLNLDDQKRFLIECLDKNLLYVPLSDIDSNEYGVTDEDKRLTREFYHKN
ncbi:site-specific DNA-methyltransferase [uncultured Prevotella sp.]|jgi:adenine specific DNA methylase mod|uniref:DNA methyltransferase n=2 Tax=Segatella TaxID=2974251 RepID=UPI002590DE3C|nr:site-specific DNA-methyltransferase [Segatella copri]